MNERDTTGLTKFLVKPIDAIVGFAFGFPEFFANI